MSSLILDLLLEGLNLVLHGFGVFQVRSDAVHDEIPGATTVPALCIDVIDVDLLVLGLIGHQVVQLLNLRIISERGKISLNGFDDRCPISAVLRIL